MLLDSVVVPSHRLVVNATASGHLLLNHLDRTSVTAISAESAKDWTSLQLPKTGLTPFVYVADRKSVKLFDLRQRAVRKQTLYDFEGCELIGGLAEPINDHQIFGCTNLQVFMLDTRMPSDAVELCHATDYSFVTQKSSVPLGCAMTKIPDSR